MKRMEFMLVLSLLCVLFEPVWSGSLITMSTKGGKVMAAEQPIRESVIAGSWYPGDPARLTRDITGYLERAPAAQIEGDLVALIVPHAGYMYSGPVAAYAYKLLEGREYDVVVIVAPSHRAYFKGSSVYPEGGYRTPLGVVPVAEEITTELMDASSLVTHVRQAHSQEHSLEIQLPFLQVILKEFRLVPIVMGAQDYHTSEELARVLAGVAKGKKCLLVASTDLSHFHPYARAVELDKAVLDKVKDFDPRGLSAELEKGRCEMCGGGPTMSVMLAARALGADRSTVLHYANSGDVTGDHSSVVGYMAAALYRSATGATRNEKNETEGTDVDEGLTEAEQATLHEIARTVIERKALGKKAPAVQVTSERLKEQRGAFVSLHKRGALRGCIGYIHGIKPLHQAVEEMAEAAAYRDPRFPPVTADEIKDLDIEISVLSPLKQISDVNEIQVGTHGIYIEQGLYSGLLLPQVATEYGWDRATFLEQTCHKAGLPATAWRDSDTRIYIFSADVF
jgi:hypothetical protein